MEKWFVCTEIFEEAIQLHTEIAELCQLMQCYAVLLDDHGRVSDLRVKAKAHTLKAEEMAENIDDMKFNELILLHTELEALYHEASAYASKLGFHETCFEFGLVKAEAHHMAIWELEEIKSNK